MIKVTKRRGHGNAQLTDKGRQYLANGDTSPGERSGEAPEVPGGTLTPPRPHPVPKARTNYTDQLLKELSANNNFLVKHVESGPHAVNWASRVNAARKSGKIPHTQDLRGKQTRRGNEWTDLPDRPLEDQLAEIVQEVDLRGEAAERDRHADEQHQEAAGQNGESAALKARAAHTHTYRVKHLEEQVHAWHQAKRLTEYVTAVHDHATSLLPGQERTEIEARLAFADAHLQQLTESASAPKLPIPPQPSGAGLEPFLGRRSPYGPRSHQAPNQAITGKASPRGSKEGAPEDRT